MRIRKLKHSDLPIRVEWVNNPFVYKSMHFDVPITLDSTEIWYRRITDCTSRADMVFEQNGDLCAMGGFTSIAKDAELYIFVNPNLQGKGLGKIALSLLCNYGFYDLHLESIYLYTNGDNIAAQKIYESTGFRICNIAKNSTHNGNGDTVDRFKYTLSLPYFTPHDAPFFKLDSFHFDNLDLKIIRDDIYPFIGGGSKARKAVEYEIFLKDSGYNAVVTCGGIQSNHNRAIALMAAKNGWKCHLCIQGEYKRFHNEKGNALLDRLSGAEIEFIKPENTAEAMDRAINSLRTKGYNPFYIHGGGHDLPGGTSFVKAVEELKRLCAKDNYKPDYIFHASGTGSTQAGIVVGLERVGWGSVKVIGISVARQKERGKQVVTDFANMLGEYYGIKKVFNEDINFCTDYLFGGYEQFTPELESFLSQVTKETGLMFDTTYSGKAFYGMIDYITKNDLRGYNIIFWHTGGLMNLLS